MASKSDRLNNEEYFRGKKSDWIVRRVTDFDGDKVWYDDAYGSSVCSRASFLNWISNDPAEATAEEIDAIDKGKQNRVDRVIDIHKKIEEMVNKNREESRYIDLSLVDDDWAKRLIDYMTDEEFKHLVKAIGESERIVEP